MGTGMRDLDLTPLPPSPQAPPQALPQAVPQASPQAPTLRVLRLPPAPFVAAAPPCTLPGVSAPLRLVGDLLEPPGSPVPRPAVLWCSSSRGGSLCAGVVVCLVLRVGSGPGVRGVRGGARPGASAGRGGVHRGMERRELVLCAPCREAASSGPMRAVLRSWPLAARLPWRVGRVAGVVSSAIVMVTAPTHGAPIEVVPRGLGPTRASASFLASKIASAPQACLQADVPAGSSAPATTRAAPIYIPT